MHVYFHIDELARDAVVASALKKEIEKAGGQVMFGNRLMTNYLLSHFNVFDAIILSSLAHYMDVFSDPENLPTNVFILQTEAIGQATGTLRRLYGKYFGDDAEKCAPWHRSVAGFLLWGHAHLNPFKEYFPAYLAKTRVVGHPRLSDSCKRPETAKARSKRVVGLVSRFNLLSPHDGRTPFQSVLSSMKFGKKTFPLFENSPDRDVEDLFFTEVIDFRLTYEIIKSLDPEKYDIRVRPHPRENRRGWQALAETTGMHVEVSKWDEPFGHWLQEIDVVVTPPSTSLYDVFFHGKSVILIDRIVAARARHLLTESDDHNQILDAACRPTSVQEVVARIATGDVPVNREIVELRLHEQVAAEIARDSIRNVLVAITELLPAASARPQRGRRQMRLGAFFLISVLASHARWIKARLSGRVEQGSSFDMTIGRISWITRLTTG